jgi:hypothetical protein
MERYQQAQELIQHFFLYDVETAASFQAKLCAFTHSFPWEFTSPPSPPEDVDVIPAPLCYSPRHEAFARRCAYTVNKVLRQLLQRLLIEPPSLSALASWGVDGITLAILEEWKKRRGDVVPINARLDLFLDLPTMRGWLVEENRIKGGLREIGDLLSFFFEGSTLYTRLVEAGFSLGLQYPYRERLRWFYRTYQRWKGSAAVQHPTLFIWTQPAHNQREERCFQQLVQRFSPRYPPLQIRIADNNRGWLYHKGQLWYEDEPVEMVFRFEKLARIEEYSRFQPLFEAYFDRRILLDTPPIAEIADNKMIQVLLSDPAYCSTLALSPGDRALLSMLLPSSKLLTLAEEEQVLRAQERLVLKTLTGAGGSGTFLGRNMSTSLWADQVKKLTGKGLFQTVMPPYVTLLPLPMHEHYTLLPVKYCFDVFTGGSLSYAIEGIAVRGRVLFGAEDLYATINMGAKGVGQHRGKLLLPLLVYA